MNNSYNTIIDIASNLIAPGSRCIISKVIENSIKDTLINKYGEDWRTREELFINTYDCLRKNFNVDSYKEDESFLYSLYYLPLNVPKVQLVLLQLLRKKKLNRNIRILDVGSSVGTTVMAIMDLVALLDNLCELTGQEYLFDKVEISSLEGSKNNIEVFQENMKYFKSRMKKHFSYESLLKSLLI